MRLIILFLAFTQLLHAQTWEQLPDFPGTPRDDAASFMIGDHIYVGTGMEVGFGLTNDWFRFDMISESWAPIASMPASPRQYCTTFTVNDTGYVFGGIDGAGALNELWAYHPSSDQWNQRTSMPAEARYACVAQEGLISAVIATGMLSSGVPTNEAWKYEASSDTWTALETVPGTARHRAASFIGSGGIVICGGADADFNALSDCWYYPQFFETGEWYSGPTLPEARYGHRGAGYLVVIGGASGTFQFHDDVWQLNEGGSTEDLPSFAGGLRRGGIAHGRSSIEPIINTIYFGLGIDQGPNEEFERKNDWWKLTYPLGINDLSKERFSIYPNPSYDRITLSLSDQWNNAVVSVHDALGRTMKHLSLPADRTLDVRDLSAGRYEVIVQGADQRTLRAPLIKLE